MNMTYQINKIYNEDCISALRNIQDKSIDLIIADPPYNLSKSNNTWKWDNQTKGLGFGGKWSLTHTEWDDMPFKDYWDFTYLWLNESKRVLSPKGSIWIFGTYHNIGIINVIMQILGIEIINEIIWYKRNAFPNLSNRRFTASHETLLWGHTGGKKRQYFYDSMTMKLSDFPEDNLKIKGKQMRTVWDIPNNKTKEELLFGKHPTQKPIRIIKRILLSSSKQNDLVLIPFAGVGSECVACSIYYRNFIGFELNNEYIKTANNRLQHLENNTRLFNEEFSTNNQVVGK